MKHTASALRLQKQRLLAIALWKQGHSQAEVARRLGVTEGAVSRWKKAYQTGGHEALLAKRRSGRPPKLTPQQCAELLRLLKLGARRHGWATDLWTLPRIVVLIQRYFGIAYDPSGGWYLLRRLGWSCQKPLRRSRQHDPAAVARWRRHDWPRIKKSAP